MAKNAKPKKKYRPKAQGQWNGVVRAYSVTGPIEEYINRLLHQGQSLVDIEGHHIYLHQAPDTYQHVGSGLQAIEAYIGLVNHRKQTSVSTRCIHEFIVTLLNQSPIEETLLAGVLEELVEARRVMSLLSIDESTSIIATLKIIAQHNRIEGNLSFPNAVVLGELMETG